MIDLYNDDCLKVLPTLKEKSIDFVLTDLPYGTTNCKWDNVIPFDEMWNELKRVIFDNSCVALFGAEPFSSALRMSNIENFKYDWIWQKTNVMGFLNAKKRPLKETEIISIFNSKIYKPQNLKKNLKGKNRKGKNTDVLGKYEAINNSEFTNYPKTIIKFKSERGLHPTQKPVALLEYLIKTYTNENDTVLDFTMGSGSTGVACKNLSRDFIGIELDKDYYKIAKQRVGVLN